MKYRIGLDIGIASVGWAVLEHDKDDNPYRIVDLGVRAFEPAEVPKTGDSLAVKRREARGARRRLRRKAERILNTRKYLQEHLLDGEVIEKQHNKDIYKLRYDAISHRLQPEDLYYVIVHFVKHRGFRSNRKSGTDSEDGKVLDAIGKNQAKMKEGGYQTIGEMIYRSPEYFEDKINVNGEPYREYFVRNHGDYTNCFLRDDLKKELEMILKKQYEYGNSHITDEFKKDIVNLFYNQRSFDDGPSAPSPYRANFAVGYCTFEKEEKRAPKGTFSFEYFDALQRINHLSYYDSNSTKIGISDETKKVLTSLLLEKGKLDYATIRKTLKLSDECRFVNLSYKQKKAKKDEEKKEQSISSIVKQAEKKNLCEFKAVSQYAKILGKETISKEDKDLYNIIGYILSMRKAEDRRRNLFHDNNNGKDDLFEAENVPLNLIMALHEYKFSGEQINKLVAIDVDKFGNLGFTALDKICDELEKGVTYDKACTLAGYNFNTLDCVKKKKIIWADLGENGTNELEEITSPVVLRAVSQTIKVINAIIDKYGSPSAVYVETAREMALDFKERNKLKKEMDERQSRNEEIVAELKKLGIASPSGQDIIKYKLYMEQDGKCAYSGKPLVIECGGNMLDVFANNNTQIDHIMPYSKCFDDSFNNKTLVLSDENQKKGNRVPREYIVDEKEWHRFEAWVSSNPNMSAKKKSRYLSESSSISDMNELNERALNDTKHASRFVLNMLANHLLFEPSTLSKRPARAVNGNITSYLRKIWGITKIRFATDKHHAIDACVVACTNARTIERITAYEKFKSLMKAKKHGCFTYQDGMHIDKLSGETYSNEEYARLFKDWEQEYDNTNKKMELARLPYETFVKELEIRTKDAFADSDLMELKKMGYADEYLDSIKPIFVSRMPRRKVLGPIHEETIFSTRVYSDTNKKVIKSREITKLTLDKDNEIKDYATFARANDPVLYNALRAQLIKFDGNGAEAFKEPFYKPLVHKNTGATPNPVKKVKVEEVVSDYVSLDDSQNKAAAKSSMVRIDVFKTNGKNYIVPIYVSDVYKGVLPNLSAPYKTGKEMNNEDFVFSLYPNDLVYMEKYKNPISAKYAESSDEKSNKPVDINKVLLYYVGFDSSTGAGTFVNNDRSIQCRPGMQGIDVIEKYTVDILGDYHKVKKETRQPLKFKRKK